MGTNDQPTPRDETPFSISRDTGAPVADTKTLADATDAMVELGKGEITEDEYHQRIGGEPDAAPPTNEPPNPEAGNSSPDNQASVTVEPDGAAATPQPSGEADDTQATSSGGATVASADAAPESVAPVEATPPPEF